MTQTTRSGGAGDPRLHSGQRTGRWRRRLFVAWVALTIAVAGYVGLAAPFANSEESAQSFVAYSVPALMILLLGLSLAWLARFVWRKDRLKRPGQD